MLKINYKEISDLQSEYLSVFNLENNEYIQESYHKFRLTTSNNFLPERIEELIIAPIEDLVNFVFGLKNINNHNKRWLKKFFNYDLFSKKIATFFIENKDRINLSTCYYCNIDYINAFKDIRDYYDGLDLIKRGENDEILKISSIGDVALNNIDNTVDDIEDLNLNSTQKNNLNLLILNDKHSHFTIDHILNKAKHPLIALSLYNYAPSCYACNSKFKTQKELIKNDNETFLSPTSKNFNFNTEVLFAVDFSEKKKRIEDITSVDDFILDFNILLNEDEYNRYIDIFKLRGRYVFHKEKVLKLIELSKDYDDSAIKEFAEIIGSDKNKVKFDIFGSELFEGKLEDKPLTKLKRDIAKNIGIEGVI
jgi:hypothetical protein